MVYFLGMSHAISVLRAIDPDFAYSHHNWNCTHSEAIWSELHFANRARKGGNARAFLITPAMGLRAELRQTDTGPILSASPELWQLLGAIQPDDDSGIFFSFVDGNEHSVLSLIEYPVPFDIFWPNDDRYPFQPGRQPVSAESMQALLRKMTHGSVAIITAVRHRLPNWKIVHVMPPPPIASEEQIRKHTEDYFQAGMTRFGITPLTVRMKVYHAFCSVLQTYLDQLGVGGLYPPSQALDAMGALRDEYALGCTHANEIYGALVMRQLLELTGD